MKPLHFVFCLVVFCNNLSLSQNSALIDSGGGHFEAGPMDDLSPVMRDAIQQSLERAVDSLNLQKNNNNQSLFTVSFNWPIRLAAGVTDSGFYGISNYIDRNPAFPNQIQDYNCGTRSYDLSSGYNHTGTDIFTFPFPWYKMDNNQVEIIAAAAGTIISKADGNFDRSCGFNSNPWNAVYIQHSDGTIAWYGHMKNGSVTSKAVGQTVVAGEYLGVVGSSGSSTGPHLHFEVHDNLGNVIDPWNGPCNSAASLWANQQPYYNSTLNKIMTCSAAPVHPTCPGQETLNQATGFCPGATFQAYASYRDQQPGQVVTHKLIQPNGVNWQQWSQTFTTYYAASWWYYTWVLPASPLTGTWKYQITYLGKIYEYSFSVNTSAVASVVVTANPSGAICNGTNVTFTAAPTNGGTTPTYQWLYNNSNVGTNSPTFSSSTLANSSTVKCVVTSNRACTTGSPATSNTITMAVVNPSPVSVNILASPSGAICNGTNVTFTATPTNGGVTPSYQWLYNNGNVGTNSPTFSSNTLAHSSQVKCVLTSNKFCISGNPATSNTVTMSVANNVTAGVSITANPSTPICSGTSVSFTAIPDNGGVTPVYQWKINGGNVGTNSASFSSGPLLNNDQISCTMTSNKLCVVGNPANSNTVNVSATFCSVTVNLRAFIEGLYIPGMDSMIAALDPVNFPAVSDSITVSLVDSATHVIASTDKNVLNTNGYGTFNFSGLLPQRKYYLLFHYRNGIEIWSKVPYLYNASNMSLDFTSP
jgi:murein DD-endopeptidase MepM/ murein hydrolase activator NlpD